jgi:hypothetical protein
MLFLATRSKPLHNPDIADDMTFTKLIRGSAQWYLNALRRPLRIKRSEWAVAKAGNGGSMMRIEQRCISYIGHFHERNC